MSGELSNRHRAARLAEHQPDAENPFTDIHANHVANQATAPAQRPATTPDDGLPPDSMCLNEHRVVASLAALDGNPQWRHVGTQDDLNDYFKRHGFRIITDGLYR